MTGSSKNTSFYIIAYDIPNDRRRTKVHKLLCGFGTWTQYSLFELWLTSKEVIQLRYRLDRLLDPQRDHLRFYSMCQSCAGKVETIGMELPEEKKVYIL